jgi:UDP-N-acetylglucosamine transferase subunit ALG13
MDDYAGEAAEEVVMQVGYSGFLPKRAKYFEFVSRTDFRELVRKARVVVTSGGVGTFLEAYRANRLIIVFPRLKQFSEVLDNQAEDLVGAIEEARLALVCRTVEDLRAALRDESLLVQSPTRAGSSREQLVNHLKGILQSLAQQDQGP